MCEACSFVLTLRLRSEVGHAPSMVIILARFVQLAFCACGDIVAWFQVSVFDTYYIGCATEPFVAFSIHPSIVRVRYVPLACMPQIFLEDILHACPILAMTSDVESVSTDGELRMFEIVFYRSPSSVIVDRAMYIVQLVPQIGISLLDYV